LFDRRVSCDRYLNTYSSSKDGKKITLAPLSLSQLSKAKAQKNQDQIELLLTLGQPFLKASQHEFKALGEWLPHHMKKLNLLFLKLTPSLPDETPHDLALKRTIQHHIILGQRPMDQNLKVEDSKRVQEIQELHEKPKSKNEQANACYQVQVKKHRRQVIFNPSNLV